MLTILSGPARSGKTWRILEEIKRSPRSDLVLLTPEQASHAAERALAGHCGAQVNLRAEVLSFTRLCSRVFTELGGAADVIPDRGAKLLLMSLAVSSVAGQLRLYASRERRVHFLESLLDAREELVRTMTGPARLLELSGELPGETGKKLHDLGLICGAFDAQLALRLPDPRERLERLAELLPQSTVGTGGVFIDGFTDFTALELNVLDALLHRGSDLTVALCRDGTDSPAFAAADMTYHRLLAMAKERGVPVRLEPFSRPDESRAPALARLCERLFDHSVPSTPEGSACAELVAADSLFAECELAAGRILRWMKEDDTLRWSDVAVAARDFSAYESIAESVFSLYGIPVFLDRREDLVHRGIFALALSALEVTGGGWRREDVFRCLKTGLAGLTPDETSLLENYCITWSIRGESAWQRSWGMNPRGYAGEDSPADREALETLNALRARAAEPLLALSARLRTAQNAPAFASALYAYFDDLRLDRVLAGRAEALRKAGKAPEAELLTRSWELMVSALEQFAATLAGEPLEREEAVRLFALLLSRISAGSIPTALDSVSLGELTRLGPQRVRKLIILGADENRLPLLKDAGGVFSRREREQLTELGLPLSSMPDEDLRREFSALYTAVSAASEQLYVSWPAGSEPSFLVKRVQALLGTVPRSGAAGRAEAASQASEPLFRLALSGSAAPEAVAARAAAERLWGGRFANALSALSAPRGSLSEEAVRALYGEDLQITASRVEKFSVCRFAYFMRYGLKASERAVSVIDAPEFGNFVHFVLEHTAREASQAGGFKAIGQAGASSLAEKYVSAYVSQVMRGFEGKSPRFIFLFERLKASVLKIVADVAEEFAVSDFVPLDFELSFARGGDLPPVEVGCGDFSLRLEGKVDRVDGYVQDDLLYLRVADYKTGRTKFDLTDVWYGKGIQMLIYLFALQNEGTARYGRRIIPAGVLYSPARDLLLPMPRGSSEEEIAAERQKKLRRTGLILDDARIIEAMENGDAPKRIPVSFKKGSAAGSLATLEQLGRLAGHVRRCLEEMGREVHRGCIEANPLKSPAEDPCGYCEFAAACDFRPDRDEERKKKKLSDRQFWESV